MLDFYNYGILGLIKNHVTISSIEISYARKTDIRGWKLYLSEHLNLRWNNQRRDIVMLQDRTQRLEINVIEIEIKKWENKITLSMIPPMILSIFFWLKWWILSNFIVFKLTVIFFFLFKQHAKEAVVCRWNSDLSSVLHEVLKTLHGKNGFVHCASMDRRLREGM